jgi:hypothetical protein
MASPERTERTESEAPAARARGFVHDALGLTTVIAVAGAYVASVAVLTAAGVVSALRRGDRLANDNDSSLP